jgi:hypothetical protein
MEIAGARLVELLAGGERIRLWRAQRSDGSPATLHALYEEASARERDTFLQGARKLAAVTRNRPLPGLVDIAAVVPSEHVYIARGGVQGTMDDISVLGWGVRETVEFSKRLASAVRECHAQGIVHGCLRPANVLLDDDLHPRLSDVGMLVLDDSYEGPSDMKHDYAAYAAREVRQGQRPDVKSDVYSLGKMIYFALHGEEPPIVLEPVPLLAELEHGPPGVVRIIRKCTLRDPAGRYGTIGELIEDLERHEEKERVGIKHPEGREGLDRPSYDGGPPRDGERPSRPAPAPSSAGTRTPPKAPDSQRPQAVPRAPVSEKQPQPSAVRAVRAAEPAAEDLLPPMAARLVGVVGLVLVCGGLALAWSSGKAATSSTAIVIAGSVMFSLLLPVVGNAAVSRFGAALLFGLAAWLVDPVTLVAAHARDARFKKGSPQERGMRVQQAKDGGQRDFRRIDLSGVDLSGMDLSSLQLDGAKLRDAVLRGATLSLATLSETDLTGADLSGADLAGVDVAASVGWVDARCDGATKMPDGWKCEDNKPVVTAFSEPPPDETAETD